MTVIVIFMDGKCETRYTPTVSFCLQSFIGGNMAEMDVKNIASITFIDADTR